MISPKIFKILDNNFGPHTCDRFAIQANKVVQKYNSLLPQPNHPPLDSLL